MRVSPISECPTAENPEEHQPLANTLKANWYPRSGSNQHSVRNLILRGDGRPILILAGSPPQYDKRLIHLAFPLRIVIQS